MPLKIPPPQGFVPAPAPPLVHPFYNQSRHQSSVRSSRSPSSAPINGAPPTIRVQRISPGESDELNCEEAADRLHQTTLSAGVSSCSGETEFGAAMETAAASTPLIGQAEDASKSIHLLTPPDTAKVLQPTPTSEGSSGGGTPAFQPLSTPASPLNSAPYSPIVSKRGRSSAVSVCFDETRA